MGYSKDITVIIPTSPINTNPSTHIINECIKSIKEQLPDCKILITCDGVRPEQEYLSEAYLGYKKRLLNYNATIVFFENHVHQTGMIKAISLVRTPFVMYLEHDFKLQGNIEWKKITETLIKKKLHLIRFYMESNIIPQHEHLFFKPKIINGVSYYPTSQWSQRPHITTTEYYKKLVKLIPEDKKYYIEDTIIGEFPHDIHSWKKNKFAVYYPKGDISRVIHLDGRKDTEKYPEVKG